MRLRTAWPLALVLWAGHAVAQPAQEATVRAAGDTIVFDGQINRRSAAEFLRLLQDPAVRRLVITSGGGMVTAALDMADALFARGLDVEVPRACRSSCANYIVPAARRKLLRPGAVAWHGNMTHVLYLQQTGQASWSEELMDGARQLARRERQFYRRVGVDGFVAWFGKLAPYDVEDFYTLSAPDMQRFGMGDITESADPPPDPQVPVLTVDWDGLPAIRPAVQLAP